MKYFLAVINIRDGESEYSDYWLLKAYDEKVAYKKMRNDLIENYSAEKNQWSEEDQALDLFERIIELDYIKELTLSDFEVIKRVMSFWVIE